MMVKKHMSYIKQKNKLNSNSLKIDLENIEKSIIKSNEDIIKQKEEIVQKNKMSLQWSLY